MSRPTVNYSESSDPKPIIIGKWKAEWNNWSYDWDLYHDHSDEPVNPNSVPTHDGWWQAWMNQHGEPICQACKLGDLADIDDVMKIHMKLQKLGAPQKPVIEDTGIGYLNGANCFYFVSAGQTIFTNVAFYSSFTVSGGGAFFQ